MPKWVCATLDIFFSLWYSNLSDTNTYHASHVHPYFEDSQELIVKKTGN